MDSRAVKLSVIIGLLLLLQISQPPTIRQQLTTFLWGSTNLPTRLPDQAQTAVTSPIPDLPNLARVDRLTIQMDFGLTSNIYLFHPAADNEQLLIYHDGHEPASTTTACITASRGERLKPQ